MTQGRFAPTLQRVLDFCGLRCFALPLVARSGFGLSSCLGAVVANAAGWSLTSFLGKQTPADRVLVSEGRVSGGMSYRERPGKLMEYIRRQTAAMINRFSSECVTVQIIRPAVWRWNMMANPNAVFCHHIAAPSAIHAGILA